MEFQSGLMDVILKGYPDYIPLKKRNHTSINPPVIGEILEIRAESYDDDCAIWEKSGAFFAKLVSINPWKNGIFRKSELPNALLELSNGRIIPLLKYESRHHYTRKFYSYSDEVYAELDKGRWSNIEITDIYIYSYPNDNAGLKKAMETSYDRQIHYAEWLREQQRIRATSQSMHSVQSHVSDREIEDLFRSGKK